MVNWSDPQEIALDSQVFEKIIFVFLGINIWEIFSTCGFEWSLLSGRRKFRWPLVIYFLSRYCILFAFMGLIISISIKTKINCGALYVFTSWAGNMTFLCSSTSLMLRTVALWERKLIVVVPLGVLSIGLWTVGYRTMFIVRAAWSDTAGTCVVVGSDPSLLNVLYFYTMGFDFVILVCTFLALSTKHTARTDLWKLLFTDGLVYFLVTFSANCIPAVLNVLNLNTIMNVIATIPAASLCSVASCRAVTRLLDYTSGEVYIHSIPSGGNGSSSNNKAIRQGNHCVSSAMPRFALNRPEVLVTTEHITMSEFPLTSSDSPYAKTSHPSIADDKGVEVEDNHRGYKGGRRSSDSSVV